MREGAQAKTRSFSYKQNVQKRFRPVPLFFFFLSLPLFRTGKNSVYDEIIELASLVPRRQFSVIEISSSR